MSNKRQRIEEPVLIDYLSHARDTVHKVSEFMTIQEMLIFRRCSKASLFNVATAKESNVRMLQFVFLRTNAPRDHIEKSFDISLVRNWFDGKQFCIGVQDDIVTKSFSYRAQDYIKNKICDELPKWRINKYEGYGFSCKNPITTLEITREFEEKKYKFKAYIVDGLTFDLYIQGPPRGGEIWLFDIMNPEQFNFFIAIAREFDMPFPEGYEARYLAADWLQQNRMQHWYNA